MSNDIFLLTSGIVVFAIYTAYDYFLDKNKRF